MKTDIHPEYMDARIVCACGRVSETRATVPELHVEICSHCHPFFTGKQKLVDTAGRVERFLTKYGREEEASDMAAEVQERAESSEKGELPEELKVATSGSDGAEEAGSEAGSEKDLAPEAEGGEGTASAG